jgi:hypothetical protein
LISLCFRILDFKHKTASQVFPVTICVFPVTNHTVTGMTVTGMTYSWKMQ